MYLRMNFGKQLKHTKTRCRPNGTKLYWPYSYN